MTLAALADASAPPFIVNVAGPELVSVRETAETFGRLLDKTPRLTGTEAPNALLSDFRLHGPDVEALCGLPRGYMTTEAADVVTLPKLKRSTGSSEGGG